MFDKGPAGSAAIDAACDPWRPRHAVDLLEPIDHLDPTEGIDASVESPWPGVDPAGWPDQELLLASLTTADAPSDPWSSVTQGDPSGWLAMDLDAYTTDPAELSDAQLVDATVAWDRVASWALARQARVLAEFSRRRPGDDPRAVMCPNPCAGSEWAPDEVGMALRVSRGAATVRLFQAGLLTGVLSATLALLERGRLDAMKARAICDAVALLEPEQALAVQNRVLPRAPERTLAQLRADLARALIATDPRGAAERHRAARRQRQVRLTDRDDGMASLWALLSAPDAVAAYEWLTRLARSLGADDPRCMDARRADLLVELLTGRLEFGDAEPPFDVTPRSENRTGDDAADTDPTSTDPASRDSTGPVSTRGHPTTENSTGVAPSTAHPTPTHPTPTHSGDGEPTHREPTDGELAGGEPARPVQRGSRFGAGVADPVRDPRPGRGPAPPGRPLVHVVVPYSTLIGADDQPCELTGYGPIPATLAREIAADGVWKRLVTDPLSGALLDHGRTTYRPPSALADFVRARDVQCRSPICRRQAGNCELDHAIAWSDGGPTTESNLVTGCVHDHHLKHRPGWTVRLVLGGLVEWITPTGHRYTSDPHDYRPADDPDPPLLRRPTGKDPVPEQLVAEPTGRPRRATPSPALGADAVFGRARPARPWTDLDGPPPF